MDIETALRRYLKECAYAATEIRLGPNNEGRVVMTIIHGDDSQSEFVAVGDKLLPYPIKPPPLRVGVSGFEVFNK